MSDKQKWPAAQAVEVAFGLIKTLQPHCKLICMAGSLRRRKQEVGDIEILYVPREADTERFSLRDDDYNPAEERIEGWLREAVLKKRLSVRGMATWGSQNKLAVHIPSGIPVDLFATTEENWFCALTIRTGGKATNLRLTTGAQRLGRKLHAYGAGVELPDGVTVRADSERHLFLMCGVEYLEPEDRL